MSRSQAARPAPIDVELHLFAVRGSWVLQIVSDRRTTHAILDPLSPTLALTDLPKEHQTWDGFLRVLSPGKGFRLSWAHLQKAGIVISEHLLSPEPILARLAVLEEKARIEGRPLRFFIDATDRQDELIPRLPIELTHRDRNFLFLRKDWHAIRHLREAEASRRELPRKPSVLIATAASAPKEPTVETLDRHAILLVDKLRASGCETETLRELTKDRLRGALEDRNCDILYIACHGSEDPSNAGSLHLCDGSLSGRELGSWLRNRARDGLPLPVALLCCCSSAVPQQKSGTSGMAEWLVQSCGVQAALGFRGEVGVKWAMEFCDKIISKILEGDSIEAAVSFARSQQKEEDSQWVLPLLYGRLPPNQASADRHTSIAANQPPPQLRSILPRRGSPFFTGREKERMLLQEWLSSEGTLAVCVIHGMGGVGKTELATLLSNECHEVGRSVLWIERPDKDVMGSLVMMITACEPGYRVSQDVDRTDVSVRMRRLLASHDGLLVLDDVSQLEEIQDLLPGGRWHVLLTTRNRGIFSGSMQIELKPLTSPEDELLFCRVAFGANAIPAEMDSERLALPRLLDRLGGLPLAIELAAAAIRKGGATIQEYLSGLRAAEFADGGTRSKIHSILVRSLRELGPKERDAFRAFGALPKTGATLELVAAVLSETEPIAARRLSRLVTHSIIAPAGDRAWHYSLHPLVWEAARAELRTEPVQWLEYHRLAASGLAALARWVVEPRGKTGTGSRARWRQVSELFDGIEFQDWAEIPEGQEHLALALALIDELRQYEWSLSDRLIALNRAEEWSRGDQSTLRARVLRARGDLFLRLADLQSAQADYNGALDVVPADTAPFARAGVLRRLSELYLRSEHPNEALDACQQALDLFRQLGHGLEQADTLAQRGKLLMRRGELLAAENDFADAGALYREAGDLLGEASMLLNRGDMRMDRKGFDAAEADYLRAYALSQDARAYLEQGNACLGLGQVAYRTKQFSVADKHFKEALDLFRHGEDLLGEANVLDARGRLRFRQGQKMQSINEDEIAKSLFDKAGVDYDRALVLYRQLQDRLGEAQTVRARGELRQEQGQFAAAEKDLHQARELFDKIQHYHGSASVHAILGDFYRERDDWKSAEVAYIAALGNYKNIQDESGMASMEAALAYILLELGRKEDARNAAESARRLAATCNNQDALREAGEVLEDPRMKQGSSVKGVQ